MKSHVKSLILKFSSVFLSYPLGRLGYHQENKIPYLPISSFYERYSALGSLISLHRNYLTESGWLESINRKQSSLNGAPIPWISYPALEMLKSIDLSNKRVVEIGAGASSIYFSKRAKIVTTYEFDQEYIASIQTAALRNLRIRGPLRFKSESLRGEIEKWYQESIQIDVKWNGITQEAEKRIDWNLFITEIRQSISLADIVLIDGGPRSLIAKICSESQVKSQLIILDNSNREYERFAVSSLTAAGWMEIPFTGLGPLNPYAWTTSFFVRELTALK